MKRVSKKEVLKAFEDALRVCRNNKERKDCIEGINYFIGWLAYDLDITNEEINEARIRSKSNVIE